MRTEEIPKIRDMILETLGDDCEKIILFGSYAYGTPREESDIITARHMFEDVYPKRLEISAWHSQQSAEKALKAFLVAHDIEPPKVHEPRLVH